VIALSFDIWRRQLAPFLLLTLVITLPGHALGFAVADKRVSFTGDPMLDAAIVQLFGSTLLLIASGAIAWSAYQALLGKPTGFNETIAVGLRRLPAVVAVGLVAGLVTGIGFLCFIVPGILLWCVLYVVVPAAVIEKTGVVASLTRSSELTAGYRTGVLGVVALTVGINLMTVMIVSSFVSADSPAVWTAEVALTVLAGSFTAVTYTVTYHELRRIKEGSTDIEAFE
jgi:hypothetical protein